MKIQHLYVRLSNVTLHIAHIGPESGVLMLFLHGFPENWLAWKKQLFYFAKKGFHAVALDQRGYNLSSKPNYIADYRIDILALDVYKLVNYFKQKKVILVGHDWGANVAWWTALRFPEIIQKLVIINVPHPVVMKRTMKTNIRQMMSSWYIYFFQIPLIPEFILSLNNSLMLSVLMTNSSRKGSINKQLVSYYRNSWTKPTIHSMLNWYRGMGLGSDKKLKSIKVRPDVLILWGLQDVFIRKENISPSVKLCANAKLSVFPRYTHWIIHENSKLVNEKIFNFIT